MRYQLVPFALLAILLQGVPTVSAQHAVFGAIGDKYQALGGERSFLGAPQTDEADAPHGGRFNRFQNGVIFWHPQTGAHEVHGAILQKWEQIGGVEFGYPITDESGTVGGRGRFNHFRAVHLPSEPEASIFWSPVTDAHEVHGGIRLSWSQQEWEHGLYGYPVSDEFQDGDGRRNNFEYGFIRWTPQVGAQGTLYMGNISEKMIDRCSAEVAFPPFFDGGPGEPDTIFLKRTPQLVTDWSPVFHPGLSDGHQVRWWCHSTTGNFLDPGTWRVRSGGLACKLSAAASVGTSKDSTLAKIGAECDTTLNLIAVDMSGWTAEQSRCNSRTDFFRARLGPERLLETVCIQP
jgi:hypothetical protein